MYVQKEFSSLEFSFPRSAADELFYVCKYVVSRCGTSNTDLVSSLSARTVLLSASCRARGPDTCATMGMKTASVSTVYTECKTIHWGAGGRTWGSSSS